MKSTPWQRLSNAKAQPCYIALAATALTASIALSLGNRTVLGHIPYYYMQFLPVNALREDPIGSIAYLHSQLPLENTAFAIVVNIFRFTTAKPEYINDFWKNDSYWIGILIKQLITLFLYNYALARTSSRCLGTRATWITSLSIALLPSSLMYFLFPYSALTSAALYGFTVSTAICESNPQKRLLVASLSLSALALSHNLFSYITTFPLALCFLLDFLKSQAKGLANQKTLLTSLILLSLPIAWAIKNFIIFDITAITSWSGCALGQSITPIISSHKVVDQQLQDGWATALKNIQVSPDYNPLETYKRPAALNQRMKGEGIRNWNHSSVIQACKSSFDYNKKLLRDDPQLLSGLLASIRQRYARAIGRLGSQFECIGCDFGYDALGFKWYGKIVEAIYSFPLTSYLVSMWHMTLWYCSPALAGLLLLKQKQYRTASVMLCALLVNILESVMSVSLSTIENERMLWMLDNTSLQSLYMVIWIFYSNRFWRNQTSRE